MAAKETTFYYATGKRKTAVARVFLKPGTGQIKVNGKVLNDFTSLESGRALVVAPFMIADARNTYDVDATVKGGGPSAQLGAIKHGISRALVVIDTDKFRPALKKAGFLTRDARKVERKKYGLHKARKRPQFSKR